MDGDDLPPGHPPHGVEVVDEAVPVEPSRVRQIGGGRRRRVRGHGPYRVQPAEAARAHRLPGGRVPGVEAPHEADLQQGSGRRHIRERGPGAGRVQGDGLLAEGRQSAPGRGADQFGVRGGGRGDHDRVEVRVEEVGHAGHRGGAEGGSRLVGACGVRVRDHQSAHLGMRVEGAGVQGADPAGADESDAHGPTLARAPSGVNALPFRLFVLTIECTVHAIAEGHYAPVRGQE